MDLHATAQLMGNFGEFFGAIGVVATLGYLIVQIRQNNRMLSSNIYSSWVVTASSTLEMLTNHAEQLGAIYDDVLRTLDSLTPAERRLHSAYFVNTMNVYAAANLNYLDGAIAKTMHDAKLRNLVRIFRTTPLHRESWCSGIFRFPLCVFVDREVFPRIEGMN